MIFLYKYKKAFPFSDDIVIIGVTWEKVVKKEEKYEDRKIGACSGSGCGV